MISIIRNFFLQKTIRSTPLRLILNAYPPFIFSRIHIMKISEDLMHFEVRIRRSWMNKNLASSIFGGSIFSTVDPFYPIMYWIYFHKQKKPVIVWLKEANIKYIKPAYTDLHVRFDLTELDLNEVASNLNKGNSYQKKHDIQILNNREELVALAELIVYLKSK
ncbi:MAG: YiiD C-terminal domain-containing protein [Bacteroidetes bacterium]|nr:YiiD C-terminal domain-containing protein [Bacteroidota bacterium]